MIAAGSLHNVVAETRRRSKPRVDLRPPGKASEGVAMVNSATLMRCERCKAVISAAQDAQLIGRGARCGVCGGTLMLWRGGAALDAARDPDPAVWPSAGIA